MNYSVCRYPREDHPQAEWAVFCAASCTYLFGYKNKGAAKNHADELNAMRD